MTRLLLFAALLCCFCAPPSAEAQFFGGKSHLTPSLVADVEIVAAGKPFTVGLWLKMDAGWHTYWEFPGLGTPVTAEWKLPPGFKAGPIQWPLPQAHYDPDLEETSYIYESEVLLLVEITPPADLPPGGVDLSAALKWQVCEKVCIPGAGDVSLHLASGSAAAPSNAELFAKWRAQLPKTVAPFSPVWDLSDPKTVKVQFGAVPGEGKLLFFPLPPAGLAIKDPVLKENTVSIPIPKPKPVTGSWRGVVVRESTDGKREGWLIAAPAKAAAAASDAPPAAPIPTALQTPAPEKRSLLAVLPLAFFGGLILNVMPCVLPVIALKIFGFMRQAGQEPRRIFRLGLAFVAGVFTFFLLLALAVIQLKLHWGFQFQNPYLLAGLIALVFVFGLNLLGVFEITLASSATSTLSELSGREGYGGAFLHGLFTTLLGTSCTAPFLAGSLGYAVTQPAPVVILLFLTIAAGMSLPYFLLTAQPKWMKLLPKPGAWMDRFKQAMGFIMLAVVVWLFTVFALRGQDAIKALSWYLLALAVACWLLGVMARRGVALAVAAVITVAGYFGLLHGRLDATPAAKGADWSTAADPIPWEPFSEARLASAIQRGEPVFIDFTADWCINCHVYEAAVLSKARIGEAMKAHKVVALKADWTNGDPVLTRWLNRFGRAAVPLYVLYRPGESAPVVLDALTPQILLSELSRIKTVL